MDRMRPGVTNNPPLRSVVMVCKTRRRGFSCRLTDALLLEPDDEAIWAARAALLWRPPTMTMAWLCSRLSLSERRPRGTRMTLSAGIVL